MKTTLYKDITTETIYTLEEIKTAYAEAHNSDLPIDNYGMESIIFENLSCNGGNIQIINDDILTFCNDFAERMDADRCMSQEEIDAGNKENYIAILTHDLYIVEEIKDNLYEDNTEDMELLNRLNKLLEEVK